MNTVQLGSSSEDEDDVYLNSVAKLKALKKQAPSHPNKVTVKENIVTIEEQTEGIAPVLLERQYMNTRSRKSISGRTTRRHTQEKNSLDYDSDLEIVSVEKEVTPVQEKSDSVTELVVEEIVDSSEDENYDVNIKILWRSKDLHRLNICRNENFRKIFEHFANLEKVSVDDILITKMDRVIKKTDTPVSINLSVIDILEGGVVKKSTKEETLDEDIRSIKVQTTNKKNLTILVKRDETFEKLWQKCAEELNVEESKMKLYFDGELIAITDTPDSLDIEDEACFDLRLSS
ncbi:DNA repair protein Rad60 [Augochlora pura]